MLICNWGPVVFWSWWSITHPVRDRLLNRSFIVFNLRFIKFNIILRIILLVQAWIILLKYLRIILVSLPSIILMKYLGMVSLSSLIMSISWVYLGLHSWGIYLIGHHRLGRKLVFAGINIDKRNSSLLGVPRTLELTIDLRVAIQLAGNFSINLFHELRSLSSRPFFHHSFSWSRSWPWLREIWVFWGVFLRILASFFLLAIALSLTINIDLGLHLRKQLNFIQRLDVINKGPVL